MGTLDFLRSSVGCDIIKSLGVSPGEGMKVNVGGHPNEDGARKGFEVYRPIPSNEISIFSEAKQ